MATAAKARVSERGAKARVRVAKRTAHRAGLQPLSEMFAGRDKAVRRGEYEMLGRIMLLRTENGDIDFGTKGPFLGRLKSKEAALVLLNEWTGLPDIVSLLPDLCDSCRTTCESCHGKGQRMCMHLGCGGEGRVILGRGPCSAEGCQKQTGKPKHDCSECSGTGAVINQTAECPECKGTKMQQCPLCQGSGKMTTGRKNGAPRREDDYINGHPDPERICADCNGQGRKLKREPQPWKDYALGQLEEYTVLGPVQAILMTADQTRDPERNMEYFEFRQDKAGNLAALLVAKPDQTGQSMYLYGGDAQIEASRVLK
jgi:hypothetical protein